MQTSAIDQKYEVVETTLDERFFLVKGEVVSSIRNPKPSESSLQYWRHYFKPYGYREEQSQRSAWEHEQGEIQLVCDELGMGVVYHLSEEKVKRVFYYARP